MDGIIFTHRIDPISSSLSTQSNHPYNHGGFCYRSLCGQHLNIILIDYFGNYLPISTLEELQNDPLIVRIGIRPIDPKYLSNFRSLLIKEILSNPLSKIDNRSQPEYLTPIKNFIEILCQEDQSLILGPMIDQSPNTPVAKAFLKELDRRSVDLSSLIKDKEIIFNREMLIRPLSVEINKILEQIRKGSPLTLNLNILINTINGFRPANDPIPYLRSNRSYSGIFYSSGNGMNEVVPITIGNEKGKSIRLPIVNPPIELLKELGPEVLLELLLTLDGLAETNEMYEELRVSIVRQLATDYNQGLK